jgi:Arc/MetJ-type ribon-helix-helix transcriptional regulator
MLMTQVRKYTGVQIPTELILQIEDIINQKKLGYVSISEFIKDATRRHIIELNTNKNYQPLESGEERGEHKHEQMAERTPTQPNTAGLDNAQGKSHRADEKRVEDPQGKVESIGGEDASL